jgi:toxin ParE1/3/4
MVHYTEDAQRDLLAIGEYTTAQSGAAQRDLYFALLERTCEDFIPNNLALARPVPGRPVLQRWACERHVIYFRLVADGIEIVRILHERMLPEHHL